MVVFQQQSFVASPVVSLTCTFGFLWQLWQCVIAEQFVTVQECYATEV